jgi:GTPase SAR1 family protein
MDVLKILVVGPVKTGKTNLILSLLNEDLRMSEQFSSFQGLQGPIQNS